MGLPHSLRAQGNGVKTNFFIADEDGIGGKFHMANKDPLIIFVAAPELKFACETLSPSTGDGRDSFVAATNAATGKDLWKAISL